MLVKGEYWIFFVPENLTLTFLTFSMSPVEEAANRGSTEPNKELQLSPRHEEGIKMVNIMAENLDTKSSPANRKSESFVFSRCWKPVSDL